MKKIRRGIWYYCAALLLAGCAPALGLAGTPTATMVTRQPGLTPTLVVTQTVVTVSPATQTAPAVTGTPPTADTPAAAPGRPSLTEVPPMNEDPVPTPLDGPVAQLVEQARADLAQRLSIDPAEIKVDEINEVTWSDGSLGCPQPGMMYTQALVDGMLIRLRAGDVIYNYHSGRGGTPFLCQ